jgi:SAM-dependent methyltransferase
MPWGNNADGVALGGFRRKLYRAVLSLLQRYVSPPAKILDVGCSVGSFLQLAQTANYNPFGFDIVPEAAEYVGRLGIPAETGTSVANSFGGTEFAAITCIDVNYYWADQPAELRGIRNKLSPNGIILFRTVNKSWLFKLGTVVHHLVPGLGEAIARRAVNDHRFAMPVNSFIKTLQRAGFYILSATPRGAEHSEHSSKAVKLAFAAGYWLWRVTGLFFAPGAIVVASRRER